MTKFIPHILETYEYENYHEMIFESVPRGYNVPSIYSSLNELFLIPDKTKVTVFGYIDDYQIKTFTKQLSLIKAKLYKDGEFINLQWITATKTARKVIYALEQKSKNSSLVQATGKMASFVTPTYNHKYIDQAVLSVVDAPTESKQVVVIPEPMYKLTNGIKVLQVQNGFRELIDNYDTLNKKDFLPESIEKELKMRSLKESITYLHGLKPIPISKFTSFLNYDGYLRRVKIEKIWRIMLDGFNSSSIKHENTSYISKDVIENISLFLKRLPFELTGHQKKAIWNTLKSFSEKDASNNLIFGDVGSGKTMVSLVVSHILTLLNYQVSIIAPTSILAKQHYEEAKELLGEESVFIVHSKTTKKEKEKINKVLKRGAPVIVYGTSSVNKMEFTKLGAVFIDEEQKFGVHDKEFLQKKFKVHSILMTATPIPRTLAATMYTNYNIMKIEEKPAMQLDRKTFLINKLDNSELESIKSKMRNGEQMLVIVPAISSNDLVSSKSAEIKYGELFKGFKISTINGRMKSANIEKNTEDFMTGNVDILIATTMVDSGFSNKNLSFVFIENADRFGISQLHQIRGRVGRAEKQGYCYLVPSGSINSLKEKTKERLESLLNSENGFELSMKDIELRGSGDLRGTEQSGSDINMLDWLDEIEVINRYLKEKNK